MKHKAKRLYMPAERRETIRRNIISVLKGQTLSAKNISAETKVSEREVYDHLEHIQRTVNNKEYNFIILPAECRKCGFVFRKRDRLKKPGKCPICHGESIQEPLFSIG